MKDFKIKGLYCLRLPFTSIVPSINIFYDNLPQKNNDDANSIPKMHRFLIIDANPASSIKKEIIIPRIPAKKRKRTPQPKTAFVAPNGAFLIT